MSTLVIDIGGTKVAAAWWDRGKLGDVDVRPMVRDRHSLDRLLAELARQFPGATRVGVGVAGTTDGRTMQAVNTEVLGFWDGCALADWFAQAGLPRPLLLNDAQAAAWGEYRAFPPSAQGRWPADLLFMTLSTGVGGGLVLGGRLQQGHTFLAGHLGHIRSPWSPMDGDVQCSCGQVNCVETVASGTALARQGRHILGRECSAQDVLDEAARGDRDLRELLRHAARVVAQTIADTRAITGIGVVRLGGGLGLAPAMHEAVRQALGQLPPRFAPQLEPARLGAQAGLVGIGHWIDEQEALAIRSDASCH